MTRIVIECDPEVSWTENRNGFVKVKNIVIWNYPNNRVINIDFVNQKDRVLRGGASINLEAWHTLIKEYLKEFLNVTIDPFPAQITKEEDNE